MTRQRADLLLVARGLASSRARAQGEIAAGHVMSGGRTVAKSSEMLEVDAPLMLTGAACPWVSRGGLKLAHALEVFAIDPNGLIVLDLGASTGGFCDVLLSRNAAKIYAVDVGHGQLHDKIKADPRVVNLEGTDARRLDSTLIPEAPQLVTADLSFIALEKVLRSALELAGAGARLIALVKPQFEVGRAKIAKGGIVRDEAARAGALEHVKEWIGAQPGWRVTGETPSPVTGGDGNEEYLIAARKE